MSRWHVPPACVWIALLPLAGCGSAPTAPAGTGAAAVVQGYYDALVRRDWPAAYAALHADSRKWCSATQFASLAEQHRKGLGLEPEEVRVRSCDENGEQAVAHVTIMGHAAGKQVFYKDALTLRRDADGWEIVLPAHFGDPAR